MTRVITTLLLLAVSSQAVGQQSPGNPPEVGIRSLPKRFLKDERTMWTSPFRRSTQRSHVLKKYVVPFVLISGALIATDRWTGDILPNTVDQTRWSGRVSQLGASYSLAGMSAVTYLAGQLGGNRHAREAGLLGLEALGHTQVAVFALKQLTNRERPLDPDGGGSFWKGGNSFPSGHAASAFALATVFSYEYRHHLVVPITAYSLAGAISVSRLSARRHWVSDIAVGGSIGFLIGRFTYRRNHDRTLPGSLVSQRARLIPEVGFSRWGPALSWHF